MRTNEYNTLKEFTDEFIGEWSPSQGHWFGLDFKYNGIAYRLHTGSIYQSDNTVLSDGRTAVFGIYRLNNEKSGDEYTLLGEYADMNDLLDSEAICGRKFKDIIMDDSTEILGKD